MVVWMLDGGLDVGCSMVVGMLMVVGVLMVVGWLNENRFQPELRTMAAFVISVFVDNHRRGQDMCLEVRFKRRAPVSLFFLGGYPS
jgi:hypothetical protein